MADGVHGPDCGHWHAPDPATLGEGFSWREAILTVIAAGSRPCSGAILVLVFALAQGLFAMGIAAVVAMSLGTAVTTGALRVTVGATHPLDDAARAHTDLKARRTTGKLLLLPR